MSANGYRDLVAWQRGMDLAVSCYALGRSLREARHASLASQLERAAVSVPANIAEGKGRAGRREYSRFLTVALGSLREVETLVQIADRLKIAKLETVKAILALCDQVGRPLYGLQRSLQKPE